MKKVTGLIPIRAHGENFSITLYETTYVNGRLAIQAFCAGEHGYPEPFGRITVNIPEQPLKDDEFFVKDWSENEFWAIDALKKSGLYEPTAWSAVTGFVEAPMWRRKK